MTFMTMSQPSQLLCARGHTCVLVWTSLNQSYCTPDHKHSPVIYSLWHKDMTLWTLYIHSTANIIQGTQCAQVRSYSQKSIACLQTSILLCRSALNDLCDVYAVVSWDVLVAYSSSNTETKTLGMKAEKDINKKQSVRLSSIHMNHV